MAYTPREVKDRVAVGDDIFIVEDLGNNRIRLIPDPTHVSEPGTPVNKALLQPIEDALGAITQKLSGIGSVEIQQGSFSIAKYDDNDGAYTYGSTTLSHVFDFIGLYGAMPTVIMGRHQSAHSGPWQIRHFPDSNKLEVFASDVYIVGTVR